jgi:hypothetical protein
MHALRRTVIAITAAGALAALPACGSSPSPEEAAEPEASRSQDSDRGDTAADDATAERTALTEALQLSAAKVEAEATAVSYETRLIMLPPGRSVGPVMMRQSGSQSWDPVAFDVLMDMRTMPGMESVVDRTDPNSGKVWLRFLDEMFYVSKDGETWEGSDLAAAAEEHESAGELLDQLAYADELTDSPADQVAAALTCSDFVLTPDAPLDGGGIADLYEASMPLTDFMEAGEAGGLFDEDQLAEMRSLGDEVDGSEVVYEIWVDEQDYPVRIDMSFVFATEGTLLYSTVYSDYRTDLGFDRPESVELADPADWE